MEIDSTTWPDLPYHNWRATAVTLQLWTQIVGKVRLSLTPWVNHGWQVPFYVTARGLGTSPIPFGNEIVDIEFDFINHELLVRSSLGEKSAVALESQPVAQFYSRVVASLRGLGVPVSINEIPCEVLEPMRFSEDRAHKEYDPAATHRFWRALVQIDRVLKRFRSGFIGKVSPVHLFWGGFDLAVTRFSGRPAPLHPGGIPGLPDAVTRDAYSHEVSSAGFWPGNEAVPFAAFYSYAYPTPADLGNRPVTQGAYYDVTLGEFLLPYVKVRTAADPEGTLLDFLSTTYAAAADSGNWDRKALECPVGRPARVRQVS